MTLYVNGQAIEQSELDEEFKRLKPEYERYAQQNNAPTDPDQLREWVRENVIERTVLRQHAATLPPEPEDDNAGGVKQLDRQVKRLGERIRNTATPPTEDELAAFYKTHTDLFNRPEQVHAAHIVKHTPGGMSDPGAYAEALNIREQLRKGASFETLALQASDCPDRAGDLGFFGRGQMVPAFEDVVFNLQPGEISDVFQTPFGYHIAKVYEKRAGGAAPLAEARASIAAHLLEERRAGALDAFVDELKNQADIREDESSAG